MTPLELTTQHVIVSLQGPVRSYIPQLPFHTTALEWDVGPVPAGGAGEQVQQWEALYREIAGRVRDLMEILRGPNAP